MAARVQNLSTRGTVSTGDNVLINGFIVTGPDPKTVVVRALGPSLSDFGVSGVLADPVLTVRSSSGAIITTNDNWQTDIGEFIDKTGWRLAIHLNRRSINRPEPGTYTVVVTEANRGGNQLGRGLRYPAARR